MKLRVRGNSIRLRLTRSEVDGFAKDGLVEETTSFGAERFVYALRATATSDAENAPALSATLAGARIEVLVRADRARAWANGDDVAIEAEQELGQGQLLRLLVEKDFACLQDRPGEPDDDAYPNPNESC